MEFTQFIKIVLILIVKFKINKEIVYIYRQPMPMKLQCIASYYNKYYLTQKNIQTNGLILQFNAPDEV